MINIPTDLSFESICEALTGGKLLMVASMPSSPAYPSKKKKKKKLSPAQNISQLLIYFLKH